MTEERIEWSGHPSQWRNFGWFLSCLLVIPIPVAFWKWLETRMTVYTLSDQRLKFTRGWEDVHLGQPYAASSPNDVEAVACLQARRSATPSPV